MPLVNIYLREGTTPEYRRAIADGIHEAMVDVLELPLDDRFELIHELSPENVYQHPTFFGIERGPKSIFVQLVLNVRPVEQKRALFERVAVCLAGSPGVRQEDLFIGIVEVTKDNWWAYARHLDGSEQDAGVAKREDPDTSGRWSAQPRWADTTRLST